MPERLELGRRRSTRPRASIAYVFLSSSGIVADVEVGRRARTALSITSRLRRPRKSIFSRPIASTSCAGELRHDLLVRRPSAAAARCSSAARRRSRPRRRGSRPARVRPFERLARARRSPARPGRRRTACCSSAPGLRHSSSVWPGPSGISFAILSTTPYGHLEHAARRRGRRRGRPSSRR